MIHPYHLAITRAIIVFRKLFVPGSFSALRQGSDTGELNLLKLLLSKSKMKAFVCNRQFSALQPQSDLPSAAYIMYTGISNHIQ